MSEDALIRYENLERLCKARGWGPKELSTASGRAYSQCRDYLTWRTAKTRKSFGEKVARGFEEALKLPRGWFDQPHDENDPVLQKAASAHTQKGASALQEPNILDNVVTPSLPQAVTWEEVVSGFEKLPKQFWVSVSDQSSVTDLGPGDSIEFEKGSQAMPGDVVIVKTPAGSYLMRRYVEIEPGVFRTEGGAGHASLHSAQDGIVVVAYAVRLLKSIRRK